MKNVIIALMLFTTYSGFSQFSVRAGVNMSNISIDPSEPLLTLKSKLGFHVGVMNEFALTSNLSFRPGILFSLRGADTEILDTTISTNLTYIDVPLTFLYNFGAEDATSGFFIELGPNVQYLLSAKLEDEDVKEDFKKIDFGVIAGLGYKINSNLGIGANYNYGLADLNNDGTDTHKYKNTNISAYLNYSF